MRIAILAASLALLSAPARAQGVARRDTLAISPGATIRAELDGGRVHQGRFVSLVADTLLTEWAGGATAALLLRDITKLEVQVGSRRPVLRSVSYSLAGGGLAGALVGALAYQPCTSTATLGCLFSPKNRGESAAFGLVVGGALGLAVGTVTGLVSRDHWRRVELDSRFGRAALVTPRGPSSRTGIGLALAF